MTTLFNQPEPQPLAEAIPVKRPRIRITLERSRWRFQRWYVRGTWTSNGKKAFHSETYRHRSDAENLARAIQDSAQYFG